MCCFDFSSFRENYLFEKLSIVYHVLLPLLFFLILENNIYSEEIIRNKAIMNFVKILNFPLQKGDSLMLNGTYR